MIKNKRKRELQVRVKTLEKCVDSLRIPIDNVNLNDDK